MLFSGSCDFFGVSSMETYTVSHKDNSNNMNTQDFVLDQDVTYELKQL